MLSSSFFHDVLLFFCGRDFHEVSNKNMVFQDIIISPKFKQ